MAVLKISAGVVQGDWVRQRWRPSLVHSFQAEDLLETKSALLLCIKRMSKYSHGTATADDYPWLNEQLLLLIGRRSFVVALVVAIARGLGRIRLVGLHRRKVGVEMWAKSKRYKREKSDTRLGVDLLRQIRRLEGGLYTFCSQKSGATFKIQTPRPQPNRTDASTRRSMGDRVTAFISYQWQNYLEQPR